MATILATVEPVTPGIIPAELTPDYHLVISVSGGKDSTAMALWVERESGLENDRTYVFCDTGHEHPWTHEHIDLLEQHLGIEVVRIKGPYTFVSLCEKKGRFPSVRARFCTEELKVKPLAEWIAEHLNEIEGEHCVLQGVRADESLARAKLPVWQPDRGLWRKKNYYDAPIYRPLLRWSADDVFAIHKRHDMPPNPLYLRGMRRVGCFPCIHSSKAELRAAFELDPELLPRLIAYEEQVCAASKRGASSFFANDKTPARFHDKTCPTSGKTYPSIRAVHAWATEDGAPGQVDLFEEHEPPICMSQYGLCE